MSYEKNIQNTARKMIDERMAGRSLIPEEIRDDAVAILEEKLKALELPSQLELDAAGDTAILEAMQKMQDRELIRQSFSEYIEDLKDDSDLLCPLLDDEIAIISETKGLKEKIADFILSCRPSPVMLTLMKNYQQRNLDEIERKSAACAFSFYLENWIRKEDI